MKKIYLLAAALALPFSATAADKDSVYAWGAWSQNLQPAAGPVARVAPAPVVQPKINFRPNENQAFARVVTPAVSTTVVTPPTPTVPVVVEVAPPVVVAAAPIVPEQPQLPEIVSAPIDAPVISSVDLPDTSALSL